MCHVALFKAFFFGFPCHYVDIKICAAFAACCQIHLNVETPLRAVSLRGRHDVLAGLAHVEKLSSGSIVSAVFKKVLNSFPQIPFTNQSEPELSVCARRTKCCCIRLYN